MGHLHRPHRPNVKKGDFVRITRGEFVGMFGHVLSVTKRGAIVMTHNTYQPWHNFIIYRSIIGVRKSALKKATMNDMQGGRPFSRVRVY